MTPRTKLGPYEILAPLGAGGMGWRSVAFTHHVGRELARSLDEQHQMILSRSTSDIRVIEDRLNEHNRRRGTRACYIARETRAENELNASRLRRDTQLLIRRMSAGEA